MTEYRLNTPAEQIEILKAVIEGKAVYFMQRVNGMYEQRRFQGTLPDFNSYRYDCSTTMVRGRIQFTESPTFKGVADALGLKAEYARGTPLRANSDTFEAWYEGGALFLRKLTDRPVHIVAYGSDFTEVKNKLPESPQRVAYAHPVDPDFPSKSQTIAAKLRQHLRAKGRKFRTAQLCQTTKKTWRVSDSQLHNHHKYTLLLVLKDCVLESTNFQMSRMDLISFGCSRDTKISGELTEINGVQFRVHWN